MTTPVRLQRSRKKGSRLVSPNGLPVVCVTRGTKWGNPFKVGERWKEPNGTAHPIETKQGAVDEFENHARALLIRNPNHFEGLRGKNLACWCKAGGACHADVLLRIANA